MDVSVIIPAYNAAKTIAASIASIKAAQQQYAVEILVVDDGSTDETWQTLMHLKESTPELSVIKNTRKKGPSGARNCGLDLATGDFIAFLDADDVWYENHLILGIDYLKSNTRVDVVVFNQKIVGDAEEDRTWFGERKVIKQLLNGADKTVFIKCLIHESFFHFQASIMRRVAIGKLRLNEEVKRHEDRDFCIRLAYSDKTIHLVNEVTGVYYRDSLSLTTANIEADIRGVLDKVKILKGFSTDGIGNSSQINIELYQAYMGLTYLYRKSNRRLASLASVFSALKYNLSLKPFVELLKTLISFFRKS